VGLLFVKAKPIATSWTATLSPVGGSAVSGTATVDVPDAGMAKPDMAPPAGAYDSAKKAAPAPAGESARASITISGAKEGEYPWRVNSGKCGSSGPAVGSESAYSPIKVSADGKGTATANISFKPTPGTDYSVSVQKSKSDKAAIACGDLQGGGEPMPNMPPRDTTAPKP
jgi:hypothetical protein